jgi:hypothetical protein
MDKDLIQYMKQALGDDKIYSEKAVVRRITSNYTADVELLHPNFDVNTIDESKIISVKLSANSNGSNIFIPSLNSDVIVSYTAYNNAYVSMFSEIDSIAVSNTKSSIINVSDRIENKAQDSIIVIKENEINIDVNEGESNITLKDGKIIMDANGTILGDILETLKDMIKTVNKAIPSRESDVNIETTALNLQNDIDRFKI